MKSYILAIMLLTAVGSFAQNINQYQYAVVPVKFEFLDEPDQYRMNTFTKMHMEKYGFVTFLSDEILPADIAADACNRLYVDVISVGTLFTSKLQVVLRDCTNKILYTSPEGSSREKDNKIAYPKALREAFSYFGLLDYKYDGNAGKVKAKPVATKAAVVEKTTEALGALTANLVAGGYNLVDGMGSVKMVLRNTSAEGVFLTDRDSKTGVFFNRMGKWYYEYYSDGQLVTEIVDVKF
ncbi:MAG: hypothetical protein ITG00_07060 [Flavobacterium sp.]|nr:hypothetical protein [Flavobacterium sp.]